MVARLDGDIGSAISLSTAGEVETMLALFSDSCILTLECADSVCVGKILWVWAGNTN